MTDSPKSRKVSIGFNDDVSVWDSSVEWSVSECEKATAVGGRMSGSDRHGRRLMTNSDQRLNCGLIRPK